MNDDTFTDRAVSILDAKALQERLAPQIIREGAVARASVVVGLDVAYREGDAVAIAAAAALDASTLEPIEISVIEAKIAFPYTPGLFSFTEAPPLCKALDGLTAKADLLICDGHGVAHPRRFGLASHIGWLRGIPTIGCAKTRLVGDYEMPAETRGQWSPLTDGRDLIGAVVRTQTGVKPVFVSVGHLISLEAAVEWVLRISPSYRLPETTRSADHAVRMAMKLAAPQHK